MLLLITIVDSTSVMDANGVGIVVVIGAWVVVGGRGECTEIFRTTEAN